MDAFIFIAWTLKTVGALLGLAAIAALCVLVYELHRAGIDIDEDHD